MNSAPLRRPLGCLKASFRQNRQQRLFLRRLLATAATTTTAETAASAGAAALPMHTFHKFPARGAKIRTAFAVYTTSPSGSTPPSTSTAAATTTLLPPSPPSTSLTTTTTTTTKKTAKPPKTDVMKAYDAAQIARMDPTGARTALFSKSNPDGARVGDVLLVTPRKAGAEPFAGVLLGVRRSGIETAILLRGQLTKVGVEMWFKVYSRAVAGIDVVQRRARRARRARLTFMRQPRHDRGSVEELVKAWRKSRNVMRSRGQPGGQAAAGGGKGGRRK